MCAIREQKTVPYPLELESWVVVSLYVGAGNQTCVSGVLNLSHLSSPSTYTLNYIPGHP